jgi:hypothetical protein
MPSAGSSGKKAIRLRDTGPREVHLFLPYREILGHDLKAATPSK